MTFLRVIQSVTTNTMWFVIIARASCAHLAPRGADCKPFNASRRLGGKDTKTALRDNILGTTFESAFALDRWLCQWNAWSAKLYSLPDSRQISDSVKIFDKYRLRRGTLPPWPRGHDATARGRLRNADNGQNGYGYAIIILNSDVFTFVVVSVKDFPKCAFCNNWFLLSDATNSRKKFLCAVLIIIKEM